MSSETTIVAMQYRLQEWAAQRSKTVSPPCLENLPGEMLSQRVVPVEQKILQHEKITAIQNRCWIFP